VDVVYALGGGMGHRMRAGALARRLGGAAHILHQAPREPDAAPATRLPPGASPGWVRSWLRDALGHSGRLFVDTFPAGVARELGDAVLSAARRTVLIQRHLRTEQYDDYFALAGRFDERWLPYPPALCAWEGEVGGVHVGPLVRSLPVAAGPRAPLAVIGDAARLPPGWRALLPTGTRWVDGFFDVLPPAERYLCVGAGHNLCWELIGAGAAARHLPLPRRYDDQHRRALRLGRAALRREDVEVFLAAQ